MPTYLTIKEAADRAGKAEITIRRFVQSVIKEQARGADRKLIQPTPAAVRDMKKRKQPFSWKIAEELVAKHFTEEMKSAARPEAGSMHGTVMETLQKELLSKEQQLGVKDSQIRALTEIVQSLNERMREGNVLIASLQRHLALPEAKEEAQAAPTKERSWLARVFR